MFIHISGSCSIPKATDTMFSNVSTNDCLDMTPVGAVAVNCQGENTSKCLVGLYRALPVKKVFNIT